MTGFDPATPLGDRIGKIRAQLPPTVRLIAVTKQVPPSLMRQAYAAGIRDFGESRIQEVLPKQAELQDLADVTWHLIGHLQTNKARLALEHFDWIHSLDSLRLAQRLHSLAAEVGRRPQVCLQVKIVPDPSKFGWSPAELMADLPQLSQCTQLNFRGLMTILPQGLSPTEALDLFHRTRQLRDQIREQQWPNLLLPELSMGMSGDYPLAVEAGATLVRLGRILFGDRPTPATGTGKRETHP